MLFQFFGLELKYILLNILTILVVTNILVCFVKRWWIASIITNTLFFVISVVNYYVIQFHSMPLSVNEIRNLGTAMGVIGSYKLKVDRFVAFIILFYIISLAFIFLLKKSEGEIIYTWKRVLIQDLIVCSLSGIIIYKGYLSENAIKGAKNIEYAWQDTFHKYGYVACSIDLIRQAIHVIQKPNGYSEEKIQNLVSTETAPEQVQNTPDIILILNETFFDLRQVADIEADQEFLSYWDNTSNAVKGFAVAPLVGGGTNCSEYEVLTGNSLQIMPGITPFYVLDLENSNSIAENLRELGYSTLAAHSESKNSYNRFQSYPKLGFEQTKFDSEFKDKEYYGDRKYFETDQSLYKNLITWYENMPEEKPRFMYLLTIQNHGDWDINAGDEDIVHVDNDFTTVTDHVNEYLSCIKKSDEAFHALLEYFENVDRQVVVCMLGDHSPWIANSIFDEKYLAEKDIRLRGTPFMIWSNVEIEEKDLGYISMNYLTPTLFEVAGVKTSPYYKYMQQLKADLPIISSYGKYYDKAGNVYDYDENTIYTERINNYFNLEFNALNGGIASKILNIPSE